MRVSRVWDLLSCSNDSLNVIAASFLVALAAVAASATPKEEGREYYSLQGDHAPFIYIKAPVELILRALFTTNLNGLFFRLEEYK